MKRRIYFGASSARTLLIVISLLSIPANISYADFTSDAIIITLRHQDGIWLDSTMAAEIDSGLVAARAEIDTLEFIHALLDYVLDELIVATDAPWNLAWRQGGVLTGELYIDSLSIEYNMTGVEYHDYPWGDTFILNFASPLEMWGLSELYENHPEVNYSEPNGMLGDGDNIQHLKKEGMLHFAFSKGWGDCPAGCIHRYYWYVTVFLSDTASFVHLEEEKYRDLSSPYIYRWNIPYRYAMTMFTSADSILLTITDSPEWWVRRHAIEGTWRFFANFSPWVGEDMNDHWYVLQNELKTRLFDVISALQSAVDDADPDVSASAEYALTQIAPISVEEESASQPSFALYQNYPNPFNLTTTIPYQLDKPAKVRILIYNIMGQQIRYLVNEYQDSGYYAVSWNGENQFGNAVASGIYFCRIKVGSSTKTMRMLLLK